MPQSNPFATQMLSSWYETLPGSFISELEREQLVPILEHIFGHCLLQVGGPIKKRVLPESPMALRVYVSNQPITNTSVLALQTDLAELPLAPNSIDAIVLFHMLEFEQQPQQVLQQLYQALVPNGQLILFGFNPWSLWGLRKLYRAPAGFPWEGTFWSAGKIKRWLRAIGYSMIAQKTVGFRPPLGDAGWNRRLLFLEAIGQFCLPACGASYLLVAQKRVYGATPIVENFWRKKIAVNNGCAEPTARNM